jgi:hypothetical protein
MHGAAMAENHDFNRELGSLLAHIEMLNCEMKELKKDVRELRDDFSAVKGGSRVIIGLAAIFGGGMTWALNHFFGKA